MGWSQKNVRVQLISFEGMLAKKTVTVDELHVDPISEKTRYTIKHGSVTETRAWYQLVFETDTDPMVQACLQHAIKVEDARVRLSNMKHELKNLEGWK